MWETVFFRELVKRFHFHTVDACEYGSDRKKATAFLANFRAVRLQQRCQGTHVHKPWNLEKTEDGQWRFDTASEAEYPTKLARELAASFLDELQTTRHFKFQEYLEDHAAKVSSEAQPRRTRGPLLMSDFKPKVEIQCSSDCSPPEKIPEDATEPWQGVPVGSKRIDIQPVLNEMGEKVRLRVTYGTYFSPDEFIAHNFLIVTHLTCHLHWTVRTWMPFLSYWATALLRWPLTVQRCWVTTLRAQSKGRSFAQQPGS